MTPDLMFECLLVSQDTGVLRVMDRLLEQLSIRTAVCTTPSRALELLQENTADLIVVDSEDDGAVSEFLRQIWSSRGKRKPTTVVISELDRPIAGAHVLLRKPFTTEKAEQSLKVAYSNMVRDDRRHARFSVMRSVVAKNQNNRTVRMTITDMNQGGVGLSTKEKLAIGDVLKFDLLLPGTETVIRPEIRVLWTRPHGVAGGELSRILPGDFNILHHWLGAKYRIRKPVPSL